MKKYTYEEVYNKSLEYFYGDEMAAKTFTDKYSLQDREGNFYEPTPDEMHRRLAKEFARIEKKYANPLDEETIYNYFQNFTWIVPQGSPMNAIGNDFQVQSASNCFVISPPEDSYAGIMRTDQEEAQIMKRRGGVGFDISTIRPRGSTTANAAKTTDGIGLFMERFSNTCREVAQGGRRGALMLTISVHHPEIRTFIHIKEDLKKVTGANISIRLTDEFMEAVRNDANVELRFPVEKNVKHSQAESTSAKALWDEIIEAAWKSAEPGLLFWDTALKYTPSDIYEKFGYRSTATNPCVVGSTLIATADGRNAVSISKLAEDSIDVPVYSVNTETGKTEIKMGRNPRKTGEKKEVWKLILDDGSSLIATPDHKIMKKDRSYIELKDLKQGDSVFPFNSFDSNRYRQITNTGELMTGGNRRNRRQYRLIHEFYTNQIVDAKKYAIHHIDFDSKNDNINNLMILEHEEHRKLHADKMMGLKNPYHRMTDEFKLKFASHPGASNGKWIDVSNEELIEHGKKVFEVNGKFTMTTWQKYAKGNKLPQTINNKARFGTFEKFASLVVGNHKVVSVEPFGFEDVYNITVDDNHNYMVITSNDDKNFISSSGLCVKNCGEIILSNFDSCRLLVVNLLSFVIEPFTVNARFDYAKYKEVVMVAQRLMDDMIDLELEQIDKILDKIKADPERADTKLTELTLWNSIKKACSAGRRTGLGITALGDTLAALNVKYGSDHSIELTEEIYRNLAINAYTATCLLAKERGAFPIYDYDLEKDHVFIKRVMEQDEELQKLYKKYGRRNIALTTTAPTGCSVKETKILTSDGLKTISDIFDENGIDVNELEKEKVSNKWFSLKKEMFVPDVDGENRKITKLYANGYANTKKITFEDGTNFEATYEHKVLVLDEENPEFGVWKKIEDLKENDKIIQLSPPQV